MILSEQTGESGNSASLDSSMGQRKNTVPRNAPPDVEAAIRKAQSEIAAEVPTPDLNLGVTLVSAMLQNSLLINQQTEAQEVSIAEYQQAAEKKLPKESSATTDNQTAIAGEKQAHSADIHIMQEVAEAAPNAEMLRHTAAPAAQTAIAEYRAARGDPTNRNCLQFRGCLHVQIKPAYTENTRKSIELNRVSGRRS